MPVLALGGLDPAPALDDRGPDQSTLAPVNDHPDKHEPLARHGPALLDQVLGDPPTRLVHHHVLVGDPTGADQAVVGQRHPVAVGTAHDPLCDHAPSERQVVVGDQVGVLAVNGNEQLGIGGVVQRQELVGLAVPGRVDPQLAAVHQLHTTSGQGVVKARDGGLVAGDRVRREHHGVSVADREEAVAAVGQALQGRPGLALRARADHTGACRIQVVDLGIGGQHPVGDPEQAQLTRQGDVAYHRRAHDHQRPPGRRCGVGHLLDPVHVAGERPDDDPPALVGLEDLAQDRPDGGLRGGGARGAGVGRIGQQ